MIAAWRKEEKELERPAKPQSNKRKPWQCPVWPVEKDRRPPAGRPINEQDKISLYRRCGTARLHHCLQNLGISTRGWLVFNCVSRFGGRKCTQFLSGLKKGFFFCVISIRPIRHHSWVKDQVRTRQLTYPRSQTAVPHWFVFWSPFVRAPLPFSMLKGSGHYGNYSK